MVANIGELWFTFIPEVKQTRENMKHHGIPTPLLLQAMDYVDQGYPDGLDEDAAYEEHRQRKVDDGECMACQNPHLPNSPYCEECQ